MAIVTHWKYFKFHEFQEYSNIMIRYYFDWVIDTFTFKTHSDLLRLADIIDNTLLFFFSATFYIQFQWFRLVCDVKIQRACDMAYVSIEQFSDWNFDGNWETLRTNWGGWIKMHLKQIDSRNKKKVLKNRFSCYRHSLCKKHCTNILHIDA